MNAIFTLFCEILFNSLVVLQPKCKGWWQMPRTQRTTLSIGKKNLNPSEILNTLKTKKALRYVKLYAGLRACNFANDCTCQAASATINDGKGVGCEF